MILHYLKTIWRSLLKDKGYSSINILGLAVAVTCSFLLIFWIKFESSYETSYPEYSQIYKVLEEENRVDGIYHKDIIKPGISTDLKETFPQIKYSTFFNSDVLPFNILGDDNDGIMVKLGTTNEDFLRIFAYDYIEGSPESVIKDSGVIMSEETAEKFFGNKSAIGQTISFGNSGIATYTISAVVKVPQNTHIKFDVLNPFSRHSSSNGIHYIKLADKYKVTEEFETQISQFISSIKEKENLIKLQCIRDIHLYSPKEITDNSFGSLAQIWVFSISVLLILLVAIINYVNTSIARSMSRVKEVGVRKVFGANKLQIIERFLFESFIISFVAIFLSLILVELFFPSFSQIMGNRIIFNLDLTTIIIAIITCIVVSILAGGYSAFYLSSFNPIVVMKGGVKYNSKDRLRKSLIAVQFFLSISVLTCSIFIYRQVNAIFNAETGVNRENIIILNTMLWYDVEDFIQIVKKENPNIIDASIASSAPYNSSYNYSGVSWTDGKESSREMSFTNIFCDHNYANTFGIEVVQGEFIPPNLKWWQHSEEKSFHIVINEAFKKIIGVDNPIGITVNYAWGMSGKIIGVVKDFNFKPLKEDISPLIISFNPESSSVLYIKTTGKDKKETLAYIIEKYKEMKPDHQKTPVMYHTVEDEYNEMYEIELRTAGLLSFFSIILLSLSLMGVVSMISFMMEKRSKDIAIRRINGAKVWDIVLLFYNDIIKMAILASLVSIPLCYFMISSWIQDYVFRTNLSLWIFLLIPIAVMLIALLVISIQIYYTSNRNLVDSLKRN